MEDKASPQKKIAKAPLCEKMDTTSLKGTIASQEHEVLRIISYNCKNVETALWAFESLSKTTDIFLIQEHWLFDCQLPKLNSTCEDFNGCGKSVDTGNPILPIQIPRGYGGTAVLWRKELDHLVTKLPDGGNRIQCIEIACEKPLILVSVYMPCKGLKDNSEEFADCLDQLTEVYQKYSSSHRVIVGGDFNEDLSSQGVSERKIKFERFIQKCNLQTKATGKTYINADGVPTSTIDYIFCSQHLIEKGFSVSRLEDVDASVSDHLPLKCLVHVNLSRATQRQASTDKPQRIRWEKVNKEDYKRRVTEELHSIQDATNSLSTMDIKVSKINEILVKSAKDLQPTRLKPKRKPKLAVWTQDIKQALSEKKKAFFNWKKENRPTAKDNALVINKKQSTQKLRKMCRMESARQREARRQEILDAKYEDSGLFHRLIRKQRGRLRQCVNELHVNGNIYHTEIDIMQGFREHFQSLAASSEVPGMDKRYCDTVSGEVTEIIDLCSSANYRHPDPLSMDQVKKAIESLNKGKAADFYGVTAEHFIYGGEELLRTTTDILNNLYKFGQLTDSMKTGVLTPVFKKKGSPNDGKNYRGITILPTLTKILETVLKETVRPAVERCQNKLQRGFTQNSSPMNCSLILEEVIREAKDLKEPLYIAFLDVKAAFDVVSHASLLRKLFHIGIEGPEWSLIHSMHVGAESVVKWEGATSDPFQVQQGVRQGGILSTDLYKLYGNRLLNRLTDLAIGAHIGETSCVAPTTADDMALVASELTVLRLVNTSVDYSLMEN
ncbi:MAG: endonuclease/exonuclease/phosphatase family protein, partial [Candidatus Thiodiazotropha taylori]|nr:endonuclease/exonuclease/phosphatase family protein [Candidatus Thiodiazotropha taylori]MCW4334818.1 reverse transcriptase domain-containing protein [Candidatus Thiodiazotropha endolucinida]